MKKDILLVSLLMLFAPALAPAQTEPPDTEVDGCWALTPKKPDGFEPSGPMHCSCSGAEMLPEIDLPGFHVGGGGGGGGGGVAANCYAVTWNVPVVNEATPGGNLRVATTNLPVTVIQHSCDTSGCRSILWGAISWGGAECEAGAPAGAGTVPSYYTTGHCDPPEAGLL